MRFFTFVQVATLLASSIPVLSAPVSNEANHIERSIDNNPSHPTVDITEHDTERPSPAQPRTRVIEQRGERFNKMRDRAKEKVVQKIKDKAPKVVSKCVQKAYEKASKFRHGASGEENMTAYEAESDDYYQQAFATGCFFAAAENAVDHHNDYSHGTGDYSYGTGDYSFGTGDY